MVATAGWLWCRLHGAGWVHQVDEDAVQGAHHAALAKVIRALAFNFNLDVAAVGHGPVCKHLHIYVAT